MATLSLPSGAIRKPKPAVIAETPQTPTPACLAGKFAVVRKAADSKNMRFTKPHDTFEQAETEAQRLMTESPDKRFFVVQILEEVTL